MVYKDQTWVVICTAAIIGALFLHHPVSTESQDTQHEVKTVCDGASVSFSWPCDLQYDLAHMMTLTFKDHVVATISGSGNVTISKDLSSRVRPRGTSGIHMDSVRILDSGVYITKAEFSNGTTIERHFTLNVHVPPLLQGGTLIASIANTSQGCQRLTCGSVIFSGFPPVSFSWNTPPGSQGHEDVGGKSIIHSCPLLPGNYTCHLTGPALACGKLTQSATVGIEMSAAMARELAAKAAQAEREELILMIVVPIVSVLLPLIILGLWVLSHLFSGRSSNYSKVDNEPTGFSSVSESNQTSPGPSSPSSPESVPLLSPPNDGEEKGGNGDDNNKNDDTERAESKKEEKVEAEKADSNLLQDIEADLTTPLMDSDSSEQINFADDAEETRI